jgi:hypothetical protein
MIMNKRSILFFPIGVAAFLIYSAQTLAVVPPVDGKGVPAVAVCPPSAAGTTGLQVLHFDKIIFTITGRLLAASPNDQPALDKVPLNTELDIKVKDNPRTVADLKGKILTFLGAADTVSPAVNDNRLNIHIIDVKYAVICAK